MYVFSLPIVLPHNDVDSSLAVLAIHDNDVMTLNLCEENPDVHFTAAHTPDGSNMNHLCSIPAKDVFHAVGSSGSVEPLSARTLDPEPMSVSSPIS